MQEIESRTLKCDVCLRPFQVVKNVMNAVGVDNEALLEVIADCKIKMELYFSYLIRANVQESRITEVFEEVERRPPETCGVLLIDYKMKFEPIFFQESSKEFYGKRGISWHGAVFF